MGLKWCDPIVGGDSSLILHDLTDDKSTLDERSDSLLVKLILDMDNSKSDPSDILDIRDVLDANEWRFESLGDVEAE